MSLCGVRAVIFDAVGTLIFPDPPAPVVYAQVGARYGSKLDADSIRPRFEIAFRDEDEVDRRQGWRTSEERERQRWRHIVARVLNDVADREACFQALFDHFSEPEAWRCDPSALPVLSALADSGVMVGLASNYDSRLRSVLAGKPDLAPLRTVCISSEIGWRKPFRKFFDAVCRSVGMLPANILFVGDDFENDMEGALEAGMRGVWLEPEDSSLIQEGEFGNRVQRIRRLRDLLPLANQS
ncbi:MAG TPA: HAD-IA family hydrolase [Gemmataceae bacterium]|jgi:putative hydrolase of the HAD superfamily|nr:HAD-IA family hydrolase [Gemmataceae bacterium]